MRSSASGKSRVSLASIGDTGGLTGSFTSRSLEEPRCRPVGEDLVAGLAVGAVRDLVRRERDALERRPALGARLAGVVVHHPVLDLLRRVAAFDLALVQQTVG